MDKLAKKLSQMFSELKENPGFMGISSCVGDLLIQFTEKEFVKLFPLYSQKPRRSYDYPTELYCDYGNIHYFALSTKLCLTCPNCGATFEQVAK